MPTKPKTSKFDSPLFIIVVILSVIGVVMVYSASSFKAQEAFGDSNFFLKRHFYKVLTGFIILLIMANVNYRVWLSLSPALVIISFVVLLYVLISPDVSAIRGSKRWLSFGFLQFQPSDLARLSLILFLSLSLGASKSTGQTSRESFLFHLMVIAALILPILLQPDVGTALLTTMLALTLLFVAGERLRHLAGIAFAALPFLAYFLTRGGYRTARIKSFMSAMSGEHVAWQAQQSLIAFGNGHILGLGLGGSKQKYHFLPDPFTDFIFSIFGEELGLLGTVLVLALFVLIVWIGFRIALNTEDFQGRILAIGLTLNVTLYAFTNMGVVLNLLPTTGVPIPFFSYGGSALFMHLASIGILLNIGSELPLARSVRGNGRIIRRP